MEKAQAGADFRRMVCPEALAIPTQQAMDSFDARGRPKRGGGWQHDTPGLNEPRMTRVQDHRTGSVKEQRHWEWVGRDIAIERSLHPGTIYDQMHEDDVAYSETGRPGGRPHK